MSARSIALAVALVAALARPAPVRALGDVEAGQRLAEAHCGPCHAPLDTDGGAPSFATVAARPETSAYSLSEFLQTPHAEMPDLALTPGEISDLAAFILSFR